MYILGITVIFLIVLLFAKLLSKQWLKQINMGYIILFIILAFHLLLHPYRIERIWQDMLYLLN